MNKLLLLGTVCTAIYILLNTAMAASFTPLGDLDGDIFLSEAWGGVSGDGLVAVGRSTSASGGEAFRWTSHSGMVGLGDLPGGGFRSTAWGGSGDGSVIVGQSNSALGQEAFHWTSSGGMVGMGDLAGGGFYSFAYGVSGDGSVVVGDSLSGVNFEAFRWTSDGGMVGLGDLPGGIFNSGAFGISDDGSVIVGSGTSTLGSEAFRWTNDSGMVGLGDLPGGSFDSLAYAVSGDGSVIVGTSTSALGTEAFRWTSHSGMVGLGGVTGGSSSSGAFDVSGDGSVIVGSGTTALGREAVLWTSNGDMKSVASILTSAGIDLTGWWLIEAMGVSADGNTIVGNGRNPDGFTEAWIADLRDAPFPTTPVDLSGTIKTVDDADICAMVLASGQFMFSCDPPGVFSLTDLPREQNGTVKRQIYADGFFPKIDILTDTRIDAVVMTRSGTCPSYITPYDPAFVPGSAGKWINIIGKVLLQNTQTPICAMVLANGQHMFSCDGMGSYALNIPLDTNGQFKLQVYADGFAPTIQTFDEFSAANDMRMARAAECQ